MHPLCTSSAFTWSGCHAFCLKISVLWVNELLKKSERELSLKFLFDNWWWSPAAWSRIIWEVNRQPDRRTDKSTDTETHHLFCFTVNASDRVGSRQAEGWVSILSVIIPKHWNNGKGLITDWNSLKSEHVQTGNWLADNISTFFNT